MRGGELVDIDPLEEADVVEAHPELRQPIFRDEKQLRRDVTICSTTKFCQPLVICIIKMGEY